MVGVSGATILKSFRPVFVTNIWPDIVAVGAAEDRFRGKMEEVFMFTSAEEAIVLGRILGTAGGSGIANSTEQIRLSRPAYGDRTVVER